MKFRLLSACLALMSLARAQDATDRFVYPASAADTANWRAGDTITLRYNSTWANAVNIFLTSTSEPGIQALQIASNATNTHYNQPYDVTLPDPIDSTVPWSLLAMAVDDTTKIFSTDFTFTIASREVASPTPDTTTVPTTVTETPTIPLGPGPVVITTTQSAPAPDPTTPATTSTPDPATETTAPPVDPTTTTITPTIPTTAPTTTISGSSALPALSSSSKVGADAASTSTPAASQEDGGGGMDPGTKIGIGIGVGVGVLLLAGLAILAVVLIRRRNRRAPPIVQSPVGIQVNPFGPSGPQGHGGWAPMGQSDHGGFGKG